MSKLLMLSGLPASGKTTRAEEIVAQGNWVRVNRDALRAMLHFDKWSNLKEKTTVEAETFLVANLLQTGMSVVVDDCNLNPKNRTLWSETARLNNVTFETEFVGEDIPIVDLVLRDLNREKSVGQHVIKNMALQYGLQPLPDKGYVICDLDGTLANIEHRLHYVQQTPKDWNGFFSHISEDILRKDVAEIIVDYYNKMHTVIFVSARPEDYRDVTLEWLRRHNMGFAWTLIMRSKGDKRQDIEVKQDIYDKYFKGKYPIEVVIDDRPSVIDMWRSNGLQVKDVGKGINF